jgi:RNA polymerase sigma factor (TIGR02999 family)
MGDITQLLADARAGRAGAEDALFKRIYGELHKLARAKLRSFEPITLLDPTVLVNEAYLKLTQRGELPAVDNRQMFYGYAANIMRSVIVDAVRERRAAKRGAGEAKVTLQTHNVGGKSPDPDVVALDDALHDLARIDERCCKVVELRYFAGLSVAEVAGVLGLSTATIERDWEKARAFLFKALAQ